MRKLEPVGLAGLPEGSGSPQSSTPTAAATTAQPSTGAAADSDSPPARQPLSVSARLGRLQFHRSGKFRVLQVTDIQDGPKVSPDTIHLLEACCDAARPDLVVFTGDQLAGYDPAFLATYRKRRWATAWDGVYATSRAVSRGVNSVMNVFGGGSGPKAETGRTGRGQAAESSRAERSGESAARPSSRSRLAGDTTTRSAALAAHQREDDLYASTRELVRQQAAQFLAPLIERGIPFAVTYGNHDFQCGLDTVDLDAIYREFPGCLNPVAPTGAASVKVSGAVRVTAGEGSGARSVGSVVADTGAELGVEAQSTAFTAVQLPEKARLRRQAAYVCEPGTFALPVAAPEGDATVMGLVLVDSGDYAPQGGYGTPSTTAVEWIRRLPSQLGAKSIIFQHIPLPQFYRLLRPVPATTAYAIQGYRTYDKQCYVIDEQVCGPGGYLGEGISCPDLDVGEFDAMQGSGGYFALFAGHDHRNAFVGQVDGIMLGATPTSGFGSYGPPAPRRAIRLFEFDIRHPHSPRTQLLEFGQLVGKPSSRAVYTFAMSHLPKGPADATNLLRKKGVTTVMAGLGAVLLGWIGLRKKR